MFYTKKAILYYFNLSPYRSWMYVDDCAEAIRRVSEQGRLGQVYNIGTEFEKCNLHLTEMIHENVGKILARFAFIIDIIFGICPMTCSKYFISWLLSTIDIEYKIMSSKNNVYIYVWKFQTKR